MLLSLAVFQLLYLGWGMFCTRRLRIRLFPTLAVGLLDFKVYLVLALRPELDYSVQPQSILAVPNRRLSSAPKVSLQCPPTTKYPCRRPKNARTLATTVKVSLYIIITPHSILFLPPILQETIQFMCNNGFRMGMLEVNYVCDAVFARRCGLMGTRSAARSPRQRNHKWLIL